MQRIARARAHSNATNALRGVLFSALCFAGCTASVGEWPEGSEGPVERDQNVGTSLPSDDETGEDGDDLESDAGTSESDDDTQEEPAGEEPGDGDEAEEEPADECAKFAVEGPAVIRQQCAGCHAASAGLGGFSSAESVIDMIDAGVIVEGSASTSRVFIRMSEGTMPPSGALPAEDLANVEGWINCGAPAP